ncbi:MAG TPA: prephenate dehydrogenase/arogenate dehydrogenase family protein [bacterium]|jgi:prephenate dehydrogenase|nr:prephenate dehydrogenase/arogenate dehydrogenase family protein [Dictyoglomota bacterium]HHV81054.1 prephenate dehydrogenase/arogenate dehydrogenase family protein [bacterium]HOK29011.1 prephenate dehydrogenase/arogenate dehydrogenase family protein [bacterium]HOL54581.1 prephenate dehydrogenase/arogenate dehydrogenase family protein [bacterium]HOP56152.1 prephenate dehydrogenase/arogenate dehydrogenase family protein [bacterium]
MRSIGIIGLGIIGGSIALSLKDKGYKIVGMNRSKEPLEKALKSNIIDEAASLDSPPETDITFVCTTVTVTPYFIRKVLDCTDKTIVIDVASTKTFIMKDLDDLPAEKLSRFTGGHPMAGSEKTGIDYAKKDLFVNATFFLTPNRYTSEETISQVKKVVGELGANPVFISPEEHDKLVAYISHLPQIISTSLSVVVKSAVEDKIVYSGRGYRDMTRLANSNFSVWRDIIATNRNNISEAIDTYKNFLDRMKSSIDRWDEKELEEIFNMAKY